MLRKFKPLKSSAIHEMKWTLEEFRTSENYISDHIIISSIAVNHWRVSHSTKSSKHSKVVTIAHLSAIFLKFRFLVHLLLLYERKICSHNINVN